MRRRKLHPFALIVCLLGISALITGCETVAHYRQQNSPARTNRVEVSRVEPFRSPDADASFAAAVYEP